MNYLKINKRHAVSRWLAAAVAAVGALLAAAAQAAVPGITGPSFNLTASADSISQPDGVSIYSWGYGCTVAPKGFAPSAFGSAANCPLMQIPGPTLIVNEGDLVTVTLTNGLPPVAGNTSIVFPGFQVATSGGTAGALTQEATPGNSVTYTFTASKPGTYAYYSGTQPDLQIEMGLYGAIIVLPSSAQTGTGCTALNQNLHASSTPAEKDYRLAVSAYDRPDTCYDREYLFQLSEINLPVHQLAEAQASSTGPLAIPNTGVYQPQYFLVNGRSFPDDLDTHYSSGYPHQPYNGNPHMHPGERMLIRVIGQGRIQHPLHIHANHARVLARDGNLLLSPNGNLAGPLLYTLSSVPGQAFDSLFGWTGKGVGYDVYGHSASSNIACVADANGYYTSASNPPAPANAPNYGEWCGDHNKPIPVTLPDPGVVTDGQFYSGTPFLGLQAGTLTPLAPGVLKQDTSGSYAFPWHSHDEREITTNNVFPGGMMMMLLVDPPLSTIDETQ